MKITAVLVDDEPKAIAILKNKIERFCTNIIIIGETQSPNEAISIIKEKKPQLVFLDIAMPQMSSFDLLKEFENPTFEIIFVTAFDQYAIDAIAHCAIGYLLKPIDNELLISTVNYAIENIEDKTALEKNKLLIQNLGVQTFQNKKIVVPCSDGLEFVEINNIVHCEGVNGYTKLHLKQGKSILSSYSIGFFNKLLNNQGFYLIHKSHFINLNYIQRYLNEGYVVLENEIKLPVSRSKRSEFLNNFHN